MNLLVNLITFLLVKTRVKIHVVICWKIKFITYELKFDKDLVFLPCLGFNLNLAQIELNRIQLTCTCSSLVFCLLISTYWNLILYVFLWCFICLCTDFGVIWENIITLSVNDNNKNTINIYLMSNYHK